MDAHSQRLADALGHVVERFDHLSMAVWDIRSALPLVELLSGRLRAGGDHRTAGFRWIQFHLPGAAKLEMVQPLDPKDERHFLVRFLRARGEGVHHVTFKVTDIEAAIGAARELGFEVVGIDLDHTNWKEAFVHPTSSNGVLVQLAEWIDQPDPTDASLDDILTPLPPRTTS